MKFIFAVLKIFGLLFNLWCFGLIWYISQIPNEAAKDVKPTDAIIVLTGGSGRLDAGISLLTQNLGTKLFISGVGKDVKIDDISSISKFKNEELHSLKDKIFLGYQADNTLQNASETKAWLEKNNFRSITLVTSNYHLPRSIAEFEAIMKGYEIIPYPVFSETVRVDKWWAFPGTLMLIMGEYNKFLLHKIK